MKIINKYFTKQLAGIFIMLLLVLTGLAWMLQIMSMMKFLLNYGIALGPFVGMTALMIPFIVSIIVPFVVFIAVIFVYNKLITDNEITVLSGAGLAPRQIARPALTLALILALVHWTLNLWIVPMTQAKFYDTQWELRYGLAHMKLQESAFTEIAPNLVAYVDRVSGHDLSQVMLSDARDKNSDLVIFAEKGKLVATARGLSIVMSGGSLQSYNDKNLTVGTFDTFDMDMNIADKTDGGSFRVRRIPTLALVQSITSFDSARQHKLALSELATRFLGPVMNLILAAVCALILLRSSLLRRRASFAPFVAVAAMAGFMAMFMSATNLITSLTDLAVLGVAQMLVLAGLLFVLFKK